MRVRVRVRLRLSLSLSLSLRLSVKVSVKVRVKVSVSYIIFSDMTSVFKASKTDAIDTALLSRQCMADGHTLVDHDDPSFLQHGEQ